MAAPTSRPAFPLAVTAAWTVLVWTTRIRNIWTDDELGLAAQLGRTALALAFTVGAGGLVAAAVALRRIRPDRPAPGWVVPYVWVFAAWTVVVWLVRGGQIARADDGIAFVVVHLVLAAVSVLLAAWSVRSVRSVQADGARRRSSPRRAAPRRQRT